MYRHKTPKYSLLILPAVCIAFTIFFSACSGSGSGIYTNQSGNTGTMPPGTGGVAFNLVWQQSSGVSGAKAAPPFNSCVDYAIQTVSAAVSNGTTTVTSLSWPCSSHQGQILGIPAGSNYTVQISGLSSGPTSTQWSGQATTINVVAGQITNAGTIVMSYVGTDHTQPTVSSIGPHSNPTNTATVPTTDRIDIAFSKPMAISTLTSTNISLMRPDTTLVPGNVIYDSSSNTASFVSSETLTYNTQYVLQVMSNVTPTITDMAGNALASGSTFTFTTESEPTEAPTATVSGVTAKAGNGQVTLDWLASSGATSYNIYYGTTSGVTTTSPTLFSGVRTPFVHLSLSNGTTYYYIVTAVNSIGESLASAEVSTMPVFPGGNPLPPASITVTPGSGQNIVTWSTVAGATAYNLYWSTRPIFPDKTAADNIIRNVASPYTHAGLANGQVYCYIVTALNTNGESADSMQVCAP